MVFYVSLINIQIAMYRNNIKEISTELGFEKRWILTWVRLYLYALEEGFTF